MGYFITGGTGFIGRFLVPRLLAKGGTVYLLVRESSLPRLDRLRAQWGVRPEKIVGVVGDLSEPNLGVSDHDISLLRGQVKHFFHLAALYDLGSSPDELEIANVEGTQHAVSLAQAVNAKCFHHVSSIAAAGLYKGTFREDMFEEATDLRNPYLQTKHDSERVVRKECRIPWRIYRPGIVIGHSKTGEMDRVNGPYHFFKLLQKVRYALPQWVPLVGIEGGRLNIVPVDFVVSAMDHIAHLPGEDGKCFHLTDPEPYRIGEVINIFAKAGHAPQMAMRIDARLFGFIPPLVRKSVSQHPVVKNMVRTLLGDLEIPEAALDFINYPTCFDSQETQRCLRGTGIQVPRLPEYAAVIWDYWERHLDPEQDINVTLRRRVEDKVCVVTGGSSGVAKATALKLAAAGARVVICSRTQSELDAAVAEIRRLGGKAHAYRCDLSKPEECDQLVGDVLRDHGRCDILINNAGRSIRRSLKNSFERFHDFERTMQLNYFGALRLIMGFTPSMLEQGRGHIINISSLAVLTTAPRFSAYVASKAALDAFTRCAAAECSGRGISFTTVHMPLVRTPMISPTRIYASMPALSPEQAADLVVKAVIHRPARVAPPLGIVSQALQTVSPKLAELIMNAVYRMTPDSVDSESLQQESEKPDGDQGMLLALMQGIYWR